MRALWQRTKQKIMEMPRRSLRLSPPPVEAVIQCRPQNGRYAEYAVYQGVGEKRSLVRKSTEPGFRALVRPQQPISVFGLVDVNGDGRDYRMEHIPYRFAVLGSLPRDGNWVRVPKSQRLSASPKLPTREELVRRLEKRMGIKLRSYGSAAVVVGSDGKGMCVGVHETSPNLLKDLASSRGANPKFVQVENRAVPLDGSMLEAAFDRAQLLNATPAYQQFIEMLRSFYKIDEGEFVRELVITASAGKVLGRRAGTGLARAEPLSPYPWAHLFHAVQERIEKETPPYSALKHPLEHAWDNPKFYTTHMVTGRGKRVGYYQLLSSPGQLKENLKLPVDIVLQLENKGGDRMWVRAAARVSKDTRFDYAKDLRGQVILVRGCEDIPDYLERCHYASLPGVRAVFPWKPYGERRWKDLLTVLEDDVDAIGVACGDLPVGRTRDRRQRVITYVREKTNAIAFLGPTSSGKTFAATKLAYSQTPYVITVHISKPEEDSTLDWAEKLGGQALKLDMPEITKLKRAEAQEQFDMYSAQIQREMDKMIERDQKAWERHGLDGLLPLVIRRNSGNDYLYRVWLRCFFNQWLVALGRYVSKQGVPVVVVIDDATVLAQSAPDPTIGEKATEATEGVKQAAHAAMNELRLKGISFFWTGHGWVSMEQAIGKGIMKDLPLAIQYSTEPGSVHKKAILWYPPMTMPQMITEVDEDKWREKEEEVKIPPGFRNFIDPWVDPNIIRHMCFPV